MPFIYLFVKMQYMLITTVNLYFKYLRLFCRWSTAYSEGDFIPASIFVDVHQTAGDEGRISLNYVRIFKFPFIKKCLTCFKHVEFCGCK